MPRVTLPQIASKIAEWFPMLGGRAVAVSEAELTAENVPTLPLAIVALNNEAATHNYKGNSGPEIAEDFIVEFWLKTEKYETNGTVSPFWAFYDYNLIRDVLLANLLAWQNDVQTRFEYRTLDIASDHFATALSMRFRQHYKWCPPDILPDGCTPSTEIDGQPTPIKVSIFGASNTCYPVECEKVEECEPCQK